MYATSPRRRPRRIEWAELDPVGVGAELRTAREMLGLPIEEAAAETRIRPGYLVALEEEEFSRLPTGVAGRGLLRAYATYLGLDAVELLSALEAHGRLPIDSGDVDLEPRRSPPAHSLARRLAGLVVAVVCVVALTYYVYSQYSAFVTAEAAGAQRAVVSARGGPPTTPPSPTPTAPSQPTVREASFAVVAPSQSPTPIPPSPTATYVPMTPMPSPTPVPPRPTPIELVVEARVSADTRARVEIDGQVFSDGVIVAGDQRTWRGATVSLQVDNAGAIEILLNGRSAGRLGSPGQARTVTWAR